MERGAGGVRAEPGRTGRGGPDPRRLPDRRAPVRPLGDGAGHHPRPGGGARTAALRGRPVRAGPDADHDRPQAGCHPGAAARAGRAGPPAREPGRAPQCAQARAEPPARAQGLRGGDAARAHRRHHPARAARPGAVRARLRLRPAGGGAGAPGRGLGRLRRRGGAGGGQGLQDADRAGGRARAARAGALPVRRAPGAGRPRAARPPALQVRPAAVHLRRAPAAAHLGPAGGPRRPGADRRPPARAAPQLRHPSAGGRRGPARDPGTAWPRNDLHHPGIHSCRFAAAEIRLRPSASTGLVSEWGESPGDQRQSDRAPRPLEAVQGDGRRAGARASGGAYSPLVKYVAGRMSSGLPGHVEESDLISYGLGGLISAIERFDLSREIKFETYAITRIRGAIIDELRNLDWVPRSVRARAREIERINTRLEARLQRAPTDEEMAAELGITIDEFQDTLLQISNSTIVALDELWNVQDATGDQVSLLDTLPDREAPDPQQLVDQSELRDRIADAIAVLPEREKLVVALYYYENLTLREIGEVLGVTESRVSQLHTKAVLRLRSKLQGELD